MNVLEIMDVYTSAPTQTAAMCASATQAIVSVVTKRTVQVQLHQGRIQDFHLGGGGARKRLYARTHYEREI